MIINEPLVYAGATYGKYTTNSTTGAQATVATADTECILFTGAGTRIQGLVSAAATLSNVARDIVIMSKNASGIPLVLQNQNTSALSINRIDTGTGYDLVIPDGGGAQLRYDAVSTRWRVISATPVSVDSFYCLAGENLLANDLVYISDGTDGRTSGRAYKCDPTNAVRYQAVGFTKVAVTAGNDCYPVTSGVITTTGLTTGAAYYASITTPGLLQIGAPTLGTQYVVPVGTALSATQLWLNIAPGALPAAAGAGSGGRNYYSTYYNGDVITGINTSRTATGNFTGASSYFSISGATSTSDLYPVVITSGTPLYGSSEYQLTSASATASTFVDFPAFTLSSADAGKPMMVNFILSGITTSGDYVAQIVRYDSGGTYQETLNIQGQYGADSSGRALLPTGANPFSGFFIPSDTDTDFYVLRIFKANAINYSIKLDCITVGPNDQFLGFNGTDWQTYTPTGSWSNTTYTGKWRRVGGNIELQLGLTLTGAPAGTLSFTFAQLTNGLGLTYDTTAIPANADKLPAGHWAGVDTGIADYKGMINASNATSATPTYFLTYDNGASTSVASISATTPFTWASGDEIGIAMTLPIVGWSSNTVQGARSVEEYAYNTGTWDANDTTSFGNGPGGRIMGGALTADRTKRVRFQTPIQSTDSHFVEISSDQILWTPAGTSNAGNVLIFNSLNSTGTFASGVYIQSVAGSSTDIDVTFGRYRYIANDDLPVADWPSTLYWRVRKVSGGASVGYPVGVTNIVETRSAVLTGNKAYKSGSISGVGNLHSVSINKPTYTCKVLVTISHMFNYVNSNGTAMSTRTVFVFKDGSTTLFTTADTFSVVEIGFSDKIITTKSVILDYPSAASYTVEVYEENSGGGSYSTSRSWITGSGTPVRI